jgi:hypothetical protein
VRRHPGPVKRGIPPDVTAATLERRHGRARALEIARGRQRRAARYNPKPDAAAYYAEVGRILEAAPPAP